MQRNHITTNAAREAGQTQCKKNHSGNKHLTPMGRKGRMSRFLECDGCGEITNR